jgi:hypothetical protein
VMDEFLLKRSPSTGLQERGERRRRAGVRGDDKQSIEGEGGGVKREEEGKKEGDGMERVKEDTAGEGRGP